MHTETTERGRAMSLHFPLPEEQPAALLAIHGAAWAQVAMDMDSWLRSEEKYHDHTMVRVDAAREQLATIMELQGVNFDMVQ